MHRFDVINYLIEKNNYKRYLEIGVEGGEALSRIKAEIKHGVDPASKHATHHVPSDQFFKELDSDIKYDIIFVDGLHVEDQVDRDIANSLNHLSPGGIIVVHDCNPPSEWHQRSYEEAQKNGCRQWNGTVWRSMVKLRASNPDVEVRVVDTDWGCGLVRPSQNPPEKLLDNTPEGDALTYKFLADNRKEALNLIDVRQFYRLY
tara:strand:- start:10746 stop:11354 length:609 start_codon:yes stop_codon:yes gene_type:complete